MSENHKQLNSLIGLSVVGCSITGVVGFIAAVFALFTGELTAAGMCLTAAALSFGLLANALLRA
jgi:hypothetical protein